MSRHRPPPRPDRYARRELTLLLANAVLAVLVLAFYWAMAMWWL
jgi:hypothetical protein